MNEFMQHSERVGLSLWSLQDIPVHMTGDEESHRKQPKVIMVVSFATFFMVLLGITLELYIGPLVVQSPAMWRFSQLVVAPVAFATLISGEWPFAILYACAVFKFGYPELTTALIVPLTREREGAPKMTKTARILLFCDGIALFIHHSGGCLMYTSITAGLIERVWLLPAVPLGLQHGLSIMKYSHEHLYTILMIGLDIWFQFEAVFLLPIMHPIPAAALWCIMISHYIWTFLGGLSLMFSLFGKHVANFHMVKPDGEAVPQEDPSMRASLGIDPRFHHFKGAPHASFIFLLDSLAKDPQAQYAIQDKIHLPNPPSMSIDGRGSLSQHSPRSRFRSIRAAKKSHLGSMEMVIPEEADADLKGTASSAQHYKVVDVANVGKKGTKGATTRV